MNKKYLSIIISLILIVLSFFYTNKIIDVFKNKDPIMQEIKEYEKKYKDTNSESIIMEDSIIPGVKKEVIDVDKSYSNMKKTRKFDKNLLVFKESTKDEYITKKYNKYIISLNKIEPNISLVFEIENTDYLDNILNILNTYKIKDTFFISKNLYDNNINIIKKIIDQGNEVELLSSNYSVYEVNKYNSLIKLLSNNKLSFCLNKDKNEELLKSCETSKLHSIVPSLIITNNLYYNVKNNLENGLIILLKNNKNNVKELSNTIKYINQKGKNIVLLKSIIE